MRLRNLSTRWYVLVAAVLVVAGAGALARCPWRAGPAPLVVAYDDVPQTLDPHFQNENVALSVLGNFYDGLVRYSAEMQLEPSLATSWEKVGDTIWRFAIRPGVRFHNGQLLTAADVVASFQRALKAPRSRLRHHLVQIRAMRALSDLTLLVETTRPTPTLLNRLSFLLVVPRADATEREITRPIGTGPYRFIERRADGSVTAEAWSGWWPRPPIQNVIFTFSRDEATPPRQFFAGAVDVLRGLPDDQVREVIHLPGGRVKSQPRLAVQMLAVTPAAATGETRRALADVRVRQAMLLALDRSKMVSQVLRGNAVVATQFVQPVIFGYDPGIGEVPYDPVKARALLAEAGFAHGFSIDMHHGFAPSAIVEALRRDLDAVGIHVNPKAAPFGELLDRARRQAIPLLYYAWICSTGDASDFLNTSIHTRDPVRGLGEENFTGYSDRQTDALIEAAEQELNPEQRQFLLRQAQRRTLEALPILPLTVRWGYLGLSARVEVVPRYDEWLWVAAYRWSH